MNYLLPERLELLAREYALGTLAGPARRRFERVLRQAPAAMRAVGAWQERLGGLASAVPPMQPSESVWRMLEERLFVSARVAPRGPLQWLWGVPKDGSAALPVGVVPGSGTASFALADTPEKLFCNVSRLAVSIEAAPAKAGDKPSGDFVLSGHCVKLW